jgi:hypothetical protein
MYEILAGKQRGLAFPVMSNGFVTIDYSDNVPDTSDDDSTTDDVAFGIWDHEGSFTFESVITPYEINGWGTYSSLTAPSPASVNSMKVMPALSQSVYGAGTEGNYQSELYLTRAARLTHEMMIFYNTNFQISLLNATLHNENEPARYKVQVRLKLGATTTTFTSAEVIVPASNGKQFKWEEILSSPSLLVDTEGRKKYRKVATISSHSGTNFTTSAAQYLFAGNKQEVFISTAGTVISLGTINTLAGSSGSQAVVLSSSYGTTITDGTPLYIKEVHNAIYTENTFHVACTYEEADRTVAIYVNGRKLTTGIHGTDATFSFSKENMYLGANGTGATGAASAVTNKQFMGELHEVSIMNQRRRKFPNLTNLLPEYDSTLLYLRFEEVDA